MLSDQWIFFTHNSPMLLQELQTQFRFAQPPADTENVARPRSRPQDGVTRTHPNLRDARLNPPRNRSSHGPVRDLGNARLRRKHRGIPPIAATSLTALARHFQPTASGGCISRKKCVPSRNQSHVRIISCPGFGLKSAASSPIPLARIRSSFFASGPAACAIFFRREFSSGY